MSLQGIFDPIVRAYFEGNGGGESGGSAEEWIGDGNTHIWISLQEGRTSPMLGIYLKGTVTVDWGDGTSPDVLTGTATNTVKYTPNHEYGKAGNYVITLTVDGTAEFSGSGSQGRGAYLLMASQNIDIRNREYAGAIKKIEVGSAVSIGSYAFSYCSGLQSIVIPNGVTSIGSNVFSGCSSIQSIVIPGSVTSIGNYAFNYCSSLQSVVIPGSVTSIGTYAFGYCSSIQSIVIPGSVTSIGTYAFSSCSNMLYYDFSKHTTVPALAAANAFQAITSSCEIRVPAALAEEWKAATNWSTYADYIVGV